MSDANLCADYWLRHAHTALDNLIEAEVKLSMLPLSDGAARLAATDARIEARSEVVFLAREVANHRVNEIIASDKPFGENVTVTMK
jgi:hypothetical protein